LVCPPTLATEWTAIQDDDFIGIAASNGIVYATVGNGSLVAYNESTGAHEWEYDANTNTNTADGPPVLSDGVAYVAFGSYVTAIDLTTHQALWTDDLDSLGISLALDGSTLYAVDATLYALDATTGATTWSTALTPAGADSSVPAIDAAGNLYIGTGTGAMDAYSSSGTLLWSDTLNVTAAFEPALDGTTLYTIATGDNNNNQLIALNTSDGSQLWETSLNPGSNGVLYAAANDAGGNGNGSLNLYNATTGATLASYPLNEQGGPPAIIANGTIYQGDDGVRELTPS
jgi:outer membrane protein assembly factor BamB